jgi:hypothetical protein
MKNGRLRLTRHLGLLLPLVLTGCATHWVYTSSFYRGRQTKLVIESVPAGEVFVNAKYMGDAPVTTSIDYGQEVKVKTRKVSYWHAQPGFAIALSILSLGIYVPFSFIPVDIETVYEPSTVFQNNTIAITVTHTGYENWQSAIVCIGEETFLLRANLKPEDNNSTGGLD